MTSDEILKGIEILKNWDTASQKNLQINIRRFYDRLVDDRLIENDRRFNSVGYLVKKIDDIENLFHLLVDSIGKEETEKLVIYLLDNDHRFENTDTYEDYQDFKPYPSYLVIFAYELIQFLPKSRQLFEALWENQAKVKVGIDIRVVDKYIDPFISQNIVTVEEINKLLDRDWIRWQENGDPYYGRSVGINCFYSDDNASKLEQDWVEKTRKTPKVWLPTEDLTSFNAEEFLKSFPCNSSEIEPIMKGLCILRNWPAFIPGNLHTEIEKFYIMLEEQREKSIEQRWWPIHYGVKTCVNMEKLYLTLLAAIGEGDIEKLVIHLLDNDNRYKGNDDLENFYDYNPYPSYLILFAYSLVLYLPKKSRPLFESFWENQSRICPGVDVDAAKNFIDPFIDQKITSVNEIRELCVRDWHRWQKLDSPYYGPSAGIINSYFPWNGSESWQNIESELEKEFYAIHGTKPRQNKKISY